MNRGVSGYVIPADMTQLLGPLLDIILIFVLNQACDASPHSRVPPALTRCVVSR
jgi:hypothetical protein